jgi:hypothetical protein
MAPILDPKKRGLFGVSFEVAKKVGQFQKETPKNAADQLVYN